MNVDFEISTVDCTVLYIVVGSFSVFAHDKTCIFLLHFSMNYRDFSVKSKLII